VNFTPYWRNSDLWDRPILGEALPWVILICIVATGTKPSSAHWNSEPTFVNVIIFGGSFLTLVTNSKQTNAGSIKICQHADTMKPLSVIVTIQYIIQNVLCMSNFT